MKPDWDKLGGHYADHPSVLIVDVDCTADGQGTCQRMGVQGYPTIKYFMSGDKKGKDYKQGRDFSSLKSFAESKLNKPVCDAATKKGCAKNEIAFIEKHEGKSVEALNGDRKSESRRAQGDSQGALRSRERAQAEATRVEEAGGRHQQGHQHPQADAEDRRVIYVI